jgi:UDP-hydrolysing UDP-N-acetyl-D-glucosamine 2-epimerase
MKTRIAVVTCARSEYGLDRWIIQALRDDPSFVLQLVVGGAHLVGAWGNTVGEIVSDGFEQYDRLSYCMASDSAAALTKSIGTAAISVATLFEQSHPDLLLVNGDRYDLLPFVSAALLFHIPMVHIGGGEVTRGAIDNKVRNAVSQLADLHLVSCGAYAENLRRMGIDGYSIRVVGAEGLENLERLRLYDVVDTSRAMGLDMSKPTVLLAFHPATDEPLATPAQQVEAMLSAMSTIPDLQAVITGPGDDEGQDRVRTALMSWADQRGGTAVYRESLGSRLFLSVMRWSLAIVGNSSAGIIEAPSLHVPTVNIGRRQEGRIRARSVLDVPYDASAIASILRRLLDDPPYRAELISGQSPFQGGRVSERVVAAIREWCDNERHPNCHQLDKGGLWKA